MVFSRYLGHKLVMPNSGRWMIHTKPTHECWICEKYTMSYFFWSPKQIAETQVHASLGIDKDKITQQIKGHRDDQCFEPLIYGQFNNWEGQKMHLVSDFVKLPQTLKTPSFLNYFMTKYDLGTGYEHVSELKPEHQSEYT